ncbi:MAG: hypothetical protein WDN08_08795 [Rhizomicrobium sp.]
MRNRFGLRPAKQPDGSPAPLDIAAASDRDGLLEGVTSFNLHAHLPHFERLGEALAKLEVLARQPVDPAAPAASLHRGRTAGFRRPAAKQSRRVSRPRADLRYDDLELHGGGLDGLQRFWRNVVSRKRAAG